ncbi:MAG: NUDIX domain-containing protein [Caldilinea sp. CFX5]|nr:NUDIX domain-containing protein [Caldilinea sp. CFX5]
MAATDALQTFIAPLTSLGTEFYDWPAARFQVNTYLHPLPPPDEFITSVRAVVFRDEAVLVVQDPDGRHILPGGRREADESYSETASREVLEETGWQVTIGPLLGFKHFYRLTPKPPHINAPDPAFAQLVYIAQAVTYHAEAREQGGYELGAEFVSLAQLAHVPLLESEQFFLQTALAVVRNSKS